MRDMQNKKFYDQIGKTFSRQDIESRPRHLKPYLEVARKAITGFAALRRGLNTLELGAGTCTMSLSLSDLGCIRRMVCMDISLSKMMRLAPQIAKAVPQSQPEKLKYLAGSFNDPLPFTDESVDIILFDASLHHASSIWDLLEECRRVLVPGGLLVAQREQYLGLLTANIALRRLLKSEEVCSGVIENSFLRSQYEYFLRARGFTPRFIPAAETKLQRLLVLARMNGLLFSKWTIVAERGS